MVAPAALGMLEILFSAAGPVPFAGFAFAEEPDSEPGRDAGATEGVDDAACGFVGVAATTGGFDGCPKVDVGAGCVADGNAGFATGGGRAFDAMSHTSLTGFSGVS